MPQNLPRPQSKLNTDKGYDPIFYRLINAVVA